MTIMSFVEGSKKGQPSRFFVKPISNTLHRLVEVKRDVEVIR